MLQCFFLERGVTVWILSPLSVLNAFLVLGSIVHGAKLLNRDFGVTKAEGSVQNLDGPVADASTRKGGGERGREREREREAEKRCNVDRRVRVFSSGGLLWLRWTTCHARARSTTAADVRTDFASLRNGNLIRNSYPLESYFAAGNGTALYRLLGSVFYSVFRVLVRAGLGKLLLKSSWVKVTSYFAQVTAQVTQNTWVTVTIQ